MMLVLSRQKDESIMIGDDVKITIVDVRGDKVRLGITAPREIPVHRMEIYEAIQREKREKAEKQTQEQPAEAAQKQPKRNTKKQAKKKSEEQPQEQPEEQHQHQNK